MLQIPTAIGGTLENSVSMSVVDMPDGRDLSYALPSNRRSLTI